MTDRLANQPPSPTPSTSRSAANAAASPAATSPSPGTTGAWNGLLAATLALVVGACAPASAPGDESGAPSGLTLCVGAGEALVTTREAALREDPRSDAAIARVVPAGAAVVPVEPCPTGGYYRVTWEDRDSGWISGNLLGKAPRSGTDGSSTPAPGPDGGVRPGGDGELPSGSANPASSGSDAGNGGGTDGGTGPGPAPGPVPQPASGKLFVGYFQSWSDAWKSNGADTTLAKLPSYLNVVNLSFMLPDATYVKGSNSLGGTGLQFSYDATTLRDAVAALRRKNPATRILVSVGGATYTNWRGFAPKIIADFVADFGLDGVDLDYEPSNPSCAQAQGSVSCPSSDAEYVGVVLAMREALPPGKWLTMAGWSVGAYGEGEWANAQPAGSLYAGIALAVLKDARASAALDLVNVMSYDAGNAFSPVQALKAYQHYFRGRITLGVEVPPEAWGGHVTTTAEIDALAAAVRDSGAAGLMLWSIQKQGPNQEFATRICMGLGLSGCEVPML